MTDDKAVRDLLVDNFFKCIRGEAVPAVGKEFATPQILNALWATLDLTVRISLRKTNPNLEEYESNLKQAFAALMRSFDEAAQK